ncbi:hypothetical protein CN160_30110 [Sinorhizobium meliloti]|nr:hypothetical protein CN160_30110 [Sinorhizobium meliloti]
MTRYQSIAGGSSPARRSLLQTHPRPRSRLIFPGKPDDPTRHVLKANGFRWSPPQGAWQGHLNESGRYAAQRVLKTISGANAA